MRVAARRPAVVAQLTIRLKLTIAFAAAMSVVLAATGVFLYLRFESELNATIDHGLRSQEQAVRVLIDQSDQGLQQSGRGLAGAGQTFAQVIRHGRVVDFTPPLSRPLLDARTLAVAARRSVTVQRRAPSATRGPVRLLAAPVRGQNGQRELIVVGTSLAQRDHALAGLATLLALGGAGALLLAGAVGYTVSTLALRTIESMRARAQTLSLASPGGRLPVPGTRDELWRLSTTLNEMLARNEQAFAREQAFVSDASHQLRTPLTILRAELEVALRAGTTAADTRRAMASAAEEAEHLSALAEDLLVIARADQGKLPVRAQTQTAGDLIAAATDRFRSRAAQLRRRVSIDAPDNLVLSADPHWSQHALSNLLDNALRHGEGPVTVSAQSAPDGVQLHVLDEGPGFRAAFLPGAFERFARSDHGRVAEGSGIGLAIVRSIAEAHGGTVGARNRPHGGADVWMTLPHPAAGEHTGASVDPKLHMNV